MNFRCIPQALGVILLTAVALVAGPARTSDTGQNRDEQASAERVLHFPKDRSLGSLFVQDADAVRHIGTFYHAGGAENDDAWEYLDQATGDVVIPSGKRAYLVIGQKAWRDLSPLSKLSPGDLYGLELAVVSVPADDRCMRHLAHLTGLRVLSLEWTDVGDEGLRSLRGMKALERLTLPRGITDAGLAHLTKLRSLRGLYFKENRITNEGLAHLTKLGALEELELGGGYKDNAGTWHKSRINDAGLVHLARLPSLRYLQLWGDFTDAGLVHLKDVPSLWALKGTLLITALPAVRC